MPTLTIENLPASLHQQLVARAKRNHRSLNNELVACLEQLLLSSAISLDTILHDARHIRQAVGPVDHSFVDHFRHEGRK